MQAALYNVIQKYMTSHVHALCVCDVSNLYHVLTLYTGRLKTSITELCMYRCNVICMQLICMREVLGAVVQIYFLFRI